MMETFYYESESHDASWNLALEQYLFDTLPHGTRLFMLWRNANAIIIGRFQNTESEINASYVRERGIQVVRRPTGGGAVYHDLGNVNYTFIEDVVAGQMPDFASFCDPVVAALKRYGVNAEVSGRNDICVDGKKISGTAQHAAGGRVMHHGTLLFDSDTEILSKALRVNGDKYSTRANVSVRSRVTNIRPLMNRDFDARAFIDLLRAEILRGVEYTVLTPGEHDVSAIRKIREERYGNWGWNYGASPAYNVVRRRYFDGCGTVELRLDVEEGTVRNAALFGDFFSDEDPLELTGSLIGIRLRREDLELSFRLVETERYLKGITAQKWISFVLGETEPSS